MRKPYVITSLTFICISAMLSAQHHHDAPPASMPVVAAVETQPFLAQAIRLDEALQFLGSSLSAEDSRALKQLKENRPDTSVNRRIQQILDPYCLAMVDINPEARVKVLAGPARAALKQYGWTSFLVKVRNEAGVKAALEVESPNASPLLNISTSQPRVKQDDIITPAQVSNRFLELSIYRNRPLLPHLSGLLLEYAVLQIYSRDAGKREAELSFNVGQGTQDIGFRNALSILFDIRPSVKVTFKVRDDDGSPAMASFIITDGIERIHPDSIRQGEADRLDYRNTLAQVQFWDLMATDTTVHDSLAISTASRLPSRQLKGIYPLPSRRIAAYDEYPDFFFQPQVYRYDGEHVRLPPGKYTVRYSRGPEYIAQSKEIVVPPGVDSMEISFDLKRWINLSKLGWFSADHHVHAAGCSHYETPEEGVPPLHMWRQVLGEDLNLAGLLAWGPSWYHQKEYFTGRISPLSTATNIMRSDVEVSGFPSSHAGHVVLLRMKEDDYPGTTLIEQWPTWTLPVLKWAKSQGALTGYAHSGWGLEPVRPTKDLPNYVMPRMDGVGANEYVVTVTQKVLDFYSAGDTPAPWELNMWYHTLNCGFRVKLSGETDFPCIYDEKVGLARTYFKSDSSLDYNGYAQALVSGRSYVSEGRSHIIDFSISGRPSASPEREVSLAKTGALKISARVAALLPAEQDAAGAAIAKSRMEEQPYWHLERARLQKSRVVPVELIVNGVPVDTARIEADGSWKDVAFDYTFRQSSWVALRILPSSHTNPIFVTVGGKPVRVKKSAEWCRQAVDQCWKMKESNIRSSEKAAARAAYDEAKRVYEGMIK